MPDTSPTPADRPAESILGPITPIRCTEPGCHWACHGVPDKYTDSRARIVREHLAAEHAPTPEPAAAAAWVDGDPLMEAMAAAVYEQCDQHPEVSVTIDDPRNIAAVAATVARQLLGTSTGEDTAAVEPSADRRARYEDALWVHALNVAAAATAAMAVADSEIAAAHTAPPAPADRAAVLHEAADFVGNDDTCDCGGCDTCIPRKLADRLRRLAGEAAAGAHQTEQAQPVVAYRDPRHPRILLCLDHGARWHGVAPVTAEDLPDGGICTFGQLSSYACGRDVLATPAAPAAPEETQ